METRLEKKRQTEVAEILTSMHTNASAVANVNIPVSSTPSTSVANDTKSTSLYSKPFKLAFYHYLIEEGLKNKELRKEFNKQWRDEDDIARLTKIRTAELFFDSIS